MDVKTTPVIEVQIRFAGTEAEQLNALASCEGISTETLLYRAIEAFLAASKNENADHFDWHAMSLAAFEKDWDNPEDAIYDQWREHYGVDTR